MRAELQPYQTRVIDERHELDRKRASLRVFIGSPEWRELPEVEQSLLNRQLGAMTMYSNVLGERIAAFTAAQVSDQDAAKREAAQEVIGCAAAVLTALNAGNIERNSAIHLKLRDVIVMYRATCCAQETTAP